MSASRREDWDPLGYTRGSTSQSKAPPSPAAGTPDGIAQSGWTIVVAPTLNTAGAVRGAGSRRPRRAVKGSATWSSTLERGGTPIAQACALPAITLPSEVSPPDGGPPNPPLDAGTDAKAPDGGDAGTDGGGDGSDGGLSPSCLPVDVPAAYPYYPGSPAAAEGIGVGIGPALAFRAAMKFKAMWMGCLLIPACASSAGSSGQTDAENATSECSPTLHTTAGTRCRTEGLSCTNEGVTACIKTGRCRLPDTCTCTGGSFQCAALEEPCLEICGSDAGGDGTVETGGGAQCASLPSTARRQGAGCSAQPGTFKELTFDSAAGTYSESCGTPRYTSQAAFDADLGTSRAGATITSHEDYVLAPTCASGSADYQVGGGPKTTFVYIWTKAP